jgi:cytohesin
LIKRLLLLPFILLPFFANARTFHEAASAGDVRALRNFIEEGEDVDNPDSMGRTALMRAAWRDRSEAMAFLLDHGADPNLQDRNGQSPLFFTLQFGTKMESLILLLEAGADTDLRDRKGYGAAEILAARGGNPGYVRTLFAYGAEPGMTTRRGSLYHTLLGRTVSPVARKFFDALYEGGVPLNQTNPAGLTPLDAARAAELDEYAEILKGLDIRLNEELIDSLETGSLSRGDLENYLFRGADPAYRNNAGYTPCHYAVASGRPDLLRLLLEALEGPLPFLEDEPELRGMVLFYPLDYDVATALPLLELLLDGGLPVNCRFEGGQTLLSAGIMHSEEAAALLLDYGADPNLPDPRGVMPLMKALTRYLVPEGTILEDLKAAGADLTARDEQGWDVLTYALLYGQDISVVRRLLDLGVDPLMRDDFGTPGFFWAAAYADDPGLVELLIPPGVRGNLRDKDGWTALMGALNFGNSPETVAYLAGLEADGRIVDGCDNGLAAFKDTYETRTGNQAPPELDLLIRNRRVYPPASVPMTGDLNRALREAVVYGGDPAVVEQLIEAGADPGSADEEGLSPLMNAAAYADASMVSVLLDRGASAFDVSPYGWTALHLAAWSSDTGSLSLLLDEGMDPDVRDFENWTPLMWAARNNASPAFIRGLLDAGARGDLLNYRKESALHLACSAWKAPEPELLELLLEAGAELDGPNTGGTTPLIYAAQMGYEKACRFLVERGADVTLSDREGETASSMAERNGFSELAGYLRLTETLR